MAKSRFSVPETPIVQNTAELLTMLGGKRRSPASPTDDPATSANQASLEQALAHNEAIPTQHLPLDSLVPRTRNRRHDPTTLASLKASIESIGLMDDLVVRTLSSGQYEVLGGNGRLQALNDLGWSTAPCKVYHVSDQVAAEIWAVSNLVRSDLNPLEETDTMLELLSLKLGLTQDEVISLFYWASNRGRSGATKNVFRNGIDPDSSWSSLEQVFQACHSRITPDSFRTQRLPLLNLPEPIQAAIREGQLEYTKARTIAQIKDSEQQAQLLQQAIAESWSLSQVKQAVRELKTDQTPDRKSVV